MKTLSFTNNELYHIALRSVGETPIFNDENEHFRGIFSLYEFNNDKSVSIRDRREQRKKEKFLQKTQRQMLGNENSILTDNRDFFVEILSFCLMPNHIHLLLKQIKDGGIPNFIKKAGGGFAKYFNTKNSRKGHLFCHFNAVQIKTNTQLRNTFAYIHVNPISIIEHGFKERGIQNEERAIRFLEKEYRWSSFFDYTGKKNFPSVTSRDFLLEFLGGPEGCKKVVCDWIKYKKMINDLDNIYLE